jgi:hypothetical protein
LRVKRLPFEIFLSPVLMTVGSLMQRHLALQSDYEKPQITIGGVRLFNTGFFFDDRGEVGEFRGQSIYVFPSRWANQR